MNALRQGLRLANVRRTWATVAQAHPRLAWTLSTLAWLPLGIAVTEYFATVMFVTGRSMQVRTSLRVLVSIPCDLTLGGS